MSDPVNQPKHYNQHPSGICCADIASGFDYCLGNVVKYIWRAGLKSANPIEDLRKAKWYLDYRIEQIEAEQRRAGIASGSDGSSDGGPGGDDIPA